MEDALLEAAGERERCKLEGCLEAVYIDERGNPKDFCTKKHALQHCRIEYTAAIKDEGHPLCRLAGCLRLASLRDGAVRGFHDFCSWTHAQEQMCADALEDVLTDSPGVRHDQAPLPAVQTNVVHSDKTVHSEMLLQLLVKLRAAWPKDCLPCTQGSIACLPGGICEHHPWELIQAYSEVGPRYFYSMRKYDGKARVDRVCKDGLGWRQSGKPERKAELGVMKLCFSYKASGARTKTETQHLVSIFKAQSESAGRGKKRKREVRCRYLMTEYCVIQPKGLFPDDCPVPVLHAVRQNPMGFPDYPPREKQLNLGSDSSTSVAQSTNLSQPAASSRFEADLECPNWWDSVPDITDLELWGILNGS